MIWRGERGGGDVTDRLRNTRDVSGAGSLGGAQQLTGGGGGGGVVTEILRGLKNPTRSTVGGGGGVVADIDIFRYPTRPDSL